MAIMSKFLLWIHCLKDRCQYHANSWHTVDIHNLETEQAKKWNQPSLSDTLVRSESSCYKMPNTFPVNELRTWVSVLSNIHLLWQVHVFLPNLEERPTELQWQLGLHVHSTFGFSEGNRASRTSTAINCDHWGFLCFLFPRRTEEIKQ